MFEIDDTNPWSKQVYESTKTGFDILRNTLIVASIGYLYTKSQSTTILIAFNLASLLLGSYIAAIFLKISFKKKFFADNASGNLFRVSISLLIVAVISFGINLGTSRLIKEAILAQNQQCQPSP